ncbi:solute carrier family 22 member 13 isoform X4 [Nelusetta ayraudi]|uniref:solute carrier family 22 member 13 isoform X4 n=1 Tax=Nelusetta ayraudi TaxID=303726 RepID=UPI003F727EB6
MSPLQRAVYWRLSLVFLLTPLLFFLDIFTVAIFATTCRLPGNGSEHRTADVNQSRPTDEPDVRQAPNAACVPVPAGRVWPRPCRPTPSTVLPGRALPDGPLLLLHQHQLLQPSCIPESPRWLLLKKKAALLDRYRQNSAADKQCINLLLDSAWTDLQKAAEAQQVLQDRGHTPSDTVLLKHPTILLRLFTMSYLSAVSALTYYGICMNVGSFGVDVYSAQFFSGLSETPCLLIPLVRLGRRALSVLTLLLSSASCFLSLLLSMLDAPPEITMTLALLGKLCILASIFISVLYSIELFPTMVRQRCVSLVNLSFRVGCLVNSLVPPNPNGAISLVAMLVYSSGPLLGCALCLLLPETSDVPLPDSVEECERQPRPRLPTLSAIQWPRKLLSSQTGKAAAEPAEKEEANTHSGFI